MPESVTWAARFNWIRHERALAGYVLGSSLDQALIPLHRMQRSILLLTLIACAVAILACRVIATMISRPIGELVQGTQRIAAGQFDTPVQVHRRDELGTLAESFNQMSQGLRERVNLLEARMKIERDLAVAQDPDGRASQGASRLPRL